MHRLVPTLVFLVGCLGCREEPKAPPAPRPPLTQAQDEWVRDVCLPAALRGGQSFYAMNNCRGLARKAVK
jgi:hypothetical protein